MVETRRLKNVVIFIQTILNFVLSRNTIKLELSWSIANIKNMKLLIFLVCQGVKIYNLVNDILKILFRNRQYIFL